MRSVTALLMVLPLITWGQWESVGGGTMAGDPRTLLFDTVSDQLYAVGDMRFMAVDTLQVNGTAMWDGAIWRPLGGGVSHPFNGLVPPVQAVCLYDSGVVIAGSQYGMSGVPNTRRVAKWQNGSWHSCGLDSLAQPYGGAVRLTVIDDTMHLLGASAIVYQGDTIERWAKYDGEHWTAGDPNEEWDFAITSLCKYQGVMYAGGNFDLSGGQNDLVRKGPNGWEELGQGLVGDPWVNDLVEYNGLLWVAGEFYQSAGNAASCLMAWDGNQWLNPFPQIQFFGQCRDLDVRNGKLYFGGAMYVDGLPEYYGLGEYDGDQVCIVGGPKAFSGRIAVSADTLYMATCKYLYCANQGPQVNTIAKWPLNAPPDACFDVEVGVQEQALPGALRIWPNPASDQITLSWPIADGGDVAAVHVFNDLGQVVLRTVLAAGTSDAQLFVGHLAAGCYSLALVGEGGELLKRATLVHQP
jgi:Secretion system C-terminal sorting domain